MFQFIMYLVDPQSLKKLQQALEGVTVLSVGHNSPIAVAQYDVNRADDSDQIGQHGL